MCINNSTDTGLPIVNLHRIDEADSSSFFLSPFLIEGGPRDPLKKRYSLTDSIMHLIEDGEIKKYLRNKSETLAERYDVIYKIFGSHSNINPQHTELKLSETSH